MSLIIAAPRSLWVFQTILYFFVRLPLHGNICKSNNCIHWGSDIMGHMVQEWHQSHRFQAYQSSWTSHISHTQISSRYSLLSHNNFSYPENSKLTVTKKPCTKQSFQLFIFYSLVQSSTTNPSTLQNSKSIAYSAFSSLMRGSFLSDPFSFL